ncbi:checkpoint protein HUS1 isoform X2 [Cimex lectularius]|uniref:Checkpoint protein n=1 Tax=Cimex lectularius TaxID=79782 RepID=A0A8I6SLX7_CIMLE|nr:checkpoint protein HUS1 isoform X2 [Cimex lectularius]
MKFRARMIEALSMKNLAVIASTISKLAKRCVLRMNTVHFSLMVCDENSSPKQILFWCILKTAQFFSDFIIKGISDENEIFLELPPDMLATSLSALKSTNSNVRCVKIRLTDKTTPCMTIEIELTTEYGMKRSYVHDIPVNLIPVTSWSDYSDPPVKDYSVSVELCQFKKIKMVLERFKKLGPYVSISITPDDLLCTTISASTVTVTTIFQNSRVCYKKENEGEQKVRVDVKRLCQLLSCEQLMPRQTTLHFFENKMIHFDLNCDNFNLHFYLLTVEE